jgi:hypothetical protein
MSTLLNLTAAVGADPAGGTGLLDWLTNKLTDLQGVFRLLSVVGGMGFVIWQGISSRGAMARIIISGIAAGIFIYIVWNVTALQTRVDNEVNAARAPATQTQVAAEPAAPGQPLTLTYPAT